MSPVDPDVCEEKAEVQKMEVEVRSLLVEVYQPAQLILSRAMSPVSRSVGQSRLSSGASKSTPKQLYLQPEDGSHLLCLQICVPCFRHCHMHYCCNTVSFLHNTCRHFRWLAPWTVIPHQRSVTFTPCPCSHRHSTVALEKLLAPFHPVIAQ